MAPNTLVLVAEKYREVAALLLSIEDVDEREAAQQHGEQVLNDELFHGQMGVAQAAGQSMILDAVFGDNNTHSRRTDDQVRRLSEYRAWKAGVPS